MSGPNPMHSSDGPCGFETQGRRGLPSESTPITPERLIINEIQLVGGPSEPQDRAEEKPEFGISN